MTTRRKRRRPTTRGGSSILTTGKAITVNSSSVRRQLAAVRSVDLELLAAEAVGILNSDDPLDQRIATAMHLLRRAESQLCVGGQA